MHYPKFVLQLVLLFLILISLSFCREKKTGFVIPMEGANIYKCNSEFICDREDSERKIPYATQIEYYTKEIKTKTIYNYYEAKYQDKTVFVRVENMGSEQKKYYFKVFPFEGTSLRSKDYKEIGKISFGEKVEFLGLADNDKYLVRFKDKEGIIDVISLVEFKEHMYFKVSTFSGLHLRESPSIKSKILITLPFQTIGEILESDNTIQTIQNKKGYWIKASYENKVGGCFPALFSFRQTGIILNRKKKIQSKDFLSSSLTCI